MREYLGGETPVFATPDPLASSYPWNSPYAYAEGDVIRSIDLDGLEKYMVVKMLDNQKRTTSISIIRWEDVHQQALEMNLRTKAGNKVAETDQSVIYRSYSNNKPTVSLAKGLSSQEKQIIADDQYLKVQKTVDGISYNHSSDNEYTMDKMPQGSVYTVSSRQFNFPSPQPPITSTPPPAPSRKLPPPSFNGRLLAPNSKVSFNSANNYMYGTLKFFEGGQIGPDLRQNLNSFAQQLRNSSVKSVVLNLLQGVDLPGTTSPGYQTANDYGKMALLNAAAYLQNQLKRTGIKVNAGSVQTEVNVSQSGLQSQGRNPGVSATIK